MKHLLAFLLLFTTILQAQKLQQYPTFSECENAVDEKKCFDYQIRKHLYENFENPDLEEGKKIDASVYFQVDQKGEIKPIYINSESSVVKMNLAESFAKLPTVKPIIVTGDPSFSTFTLRLKIPLIHPDEELIEESKSKNSFFAKTDAELIELDTITKKDFDVNSEYTSNLKIPFTHHNYNRFDYYINKVGSNNHTAVKPYIYSEVNDYYNFKAVNDSLARYADSWLKRKLFNEHLLEFQGTDYWFTFDVHTDLQLGSDFKSDSKNSFNNTRAISAQAGIGKNLSFFTSVYENQGRFASYINKYVRSLETDDGDPAIIPGKSIAKPFGDDGSAFDYASAEAYISYTPSKHFNFQFGHGRNFIGDGYKSLVLSDAVTNHPFLKINTNFWKIKYTNTYMWLQDVRPETTVDKQYARKYVANHYLSWNATKKLNIGLFESVVWDNTQNRGFDANFLNPIIYYVTTEFNTGTRLGNAMVGLTTKYKFNNFIQGYSQFIIDEFSVKDVFSSSKRWENKFGYQLGAKYFNAFNINNLTLQLEYNQVRPYTYSHNEAAIQYGHQNLALAHNLGANFRELIVIGNYNINRYFGQAKLAYAQRGLDFDPIDDEPQVSYGSNIYLSNDLKPSEDNITLLQGNKASSFHFDLTAGYLINTATNLKGYVDLNFRNFSIDTPTTVWENDNTVWLNFGIKTDIFNWYDEY